MSYATHHFTVRVAERIGPVDAHLLADELTRAVDGRLENLVEYAGKGGNGSRLYRFRIPGRGQFFALRAPEGPWLSVLLPGYDLKRGRGKRPKRLNPKPFLRGVA